MFKIIFVLIGTFVGAGFASGKEIFNFFTVYSFNGFFSIFIFSLLLFLLIYKCLNIKINLKLNSYNDFILYLENKYKFFKHKYFLLIINIFLASSFYIMISALTSLFNYQFNIEKLITIIWTIFICFFIFYKKNINFIYIINSILMPILILFVLSLCASNINLNNITFNEINNNSNIFISIFMGLLYFSYNSLLLISIIFDLKINLRKNKNSKIKKYNKINNNLKISFIFSFIIFILTFLLNLLLLSYFNLIHNIEIPILYISNSSFKFFSFFYFFIVLSAIITTMISSGYSFINNFNKNNFKIKLIVFLLFSFVFCLFSFSDLINFFYPVFGLIGFVQIFLILIDKY